MFLTKDQPHFSCLSVLLQDTKPCLLLKALLRNLDIPKPFQFGHVAGLCLAHQESPFLLNVHTYPTWLSQLELASQKQQP